MKGQVNITLLEHSEGVSASCPELPGCLELCGWPELHCEIRETEVSAA